jgi:hypothetical protein
MRSQQCSRSWRTHPDGRMEKQQRLNQSLEQVHQVVPATDVGQLVEQDELHLIWRPSAHRCGRQEDQGTHDPHQNRSGDPVADGHGDGAADPERTGQTPTEPG